MNGRSAPVHGPSSGHARPLLPGRELAQTVPFALLSALLLCQQRLRPTQQGTLNRNQGAKHKTFLWAPLLTTAGDLVFAGGTNDRLFRAYDATSGKPLWEFPARSGVAGVPTSYEVDGEQYIAVQSGWGVDAERIHGAFNAICRTARS